MKSKAIIIIIPLVLVILVTAGIFAALKIRVEDGLYKIGIIRWAADVEYDENIKAFKDSLASQGWVEGENIAYLVEDAGANVDRERAVVNSFKNQGVDLLYVLTTPGTIIAQQLNSEIPLVFSIVTYPVEAGIVKSLKSSGNNLTGTRNWVNPRVQIFNFLQMVPRATSIGFIHHIGEPNSEVQLREFISYEKFFDIKIVDIPIRSLADITKTLENLPYLPSALYLACDTLIQLGGDDQVIAFSKNHKLPSFTCVKSGVQKGALMGTVADFGQLGQLAGEKASKILNGFTPSEIEITTVARPFIYINATTAELLNIDIPTQLISQTKEIFR